MQRPVRELGMDEPLESRIAHLRARIHDLEIAMAEFLSLHDNVEAATDEPLMSFRKAYDDYWGVRVGELEEERT